MRKSENYINQINELNEKIIMYKNECGCKLGSQFMITAFAMSMFIIIYQYNIISIEFLSHIPLIIIITISAAGIGKILGITYSKHKYKQLVKQLENY